MPLPNQNLKSPYALNWSRTPIRTASDDSIPKEKSFLGNFLTTYLFPQLRARPSDRYLAGIRADNSYQDPYAAIRQNPWYQSIRRELTMTQPDQ